jgi:hypothetical protein
VPASAGTSSALFLRFATGTCGRPFGLAASGEAVSAPSSLDTLGPVKTRPGICQKKRRFATRVEADAVALAAGITLRTYKCAVCKAFHLTSRTKGLRQPRAGDADAD